MECSYETLEVGVDWSHYSQRRKMYRKKSYGLEPFKHEGYLTGPEKYGEELLLVSRRSLVKVGMN